MDSGGSKESTAGLPAIARQPLDVLRQNLYSVGIKAKQREIVGALILGALRLPLSDVAAMVQRFWREEAAAKKERPDSED